MTNLPIPSGQALVVTGSLQAKAEDRAHDRGDICPVSVINADGVTPVSFFRNQGELGVSSFVFWDSNLVYVSTGDDLSALDLDSGVATMIPVGDLVDVHEMTRVGDRLWLSNTGRDELVAVDIPEAADWQPSGLSLSESEPVYPVERVPLGPFRPNHDPSAEAVDRFHTNQVFDGPDGQLYALVHHATGRQLLKRVKSRILKSHGNGGVIDLVGRRSIDLKLTAPHSATRVGDSWWVCDSGKAELAVFDADWERQATIATSGWGRGACLSDDHSTLFVGLSPIRTRYRSTVTSPQIDQPAVEAIDAVTRQAVGLQIVDGIEQVNNVYLVPDVVAKRLLALDPA